MGHVAEWLRRGLQILVYRFDSGRGLQASPNETLKHQLFLLPDHLLSMYENF